MVHDVEPMGTRALLVPDFTLKLGEGETLLDELIGYAKDVLEAGGMLLGADDTISDVFERLDVLKSFVFGELGGG